MKSIVLIILAVIIFIFGYLYYSFHQFANGFGGNIGCLYLINTKCATETTSQFADTFLTKYPKYKVPAGLDYDWNYDHLNIKKFYFNEPPEELYIVDFSGVTTIRAVKDLDKNIEYLNTRTTEKFPSDSEGARIKFRFEKEILKPIDSLISNSNLPDSLKCRLN
jgi:hypothetical protein